MLVETDAIYYRDYEKYIELMSSREHSKTQKTKEEELNAILEEKFKNSEKCWNCIFNHRTFCYFAYPCLMENKSMKKEKER